MRKLAVITAALVLIATGCGTGSDGVTVLVDFSHDEFASFVAKNFPRTVEVHPGTEITFRQTWTGEPHTVTGGTLVNNLMDAVEPYIEKEERGEPIPDEPPKDIVKLEEKVVWAFNEESGQFGVNQTGAQPCYLSKGTPPDEGKPCKQVDQPVFDGKHTMYNSGVIPYAGPQGNEYRIPLAEDISPGAYWFYCAFHGEFQSTKVVVKPTSERVASPAQIAAQAQKEVKRTTDPMEASWSDATDDRELTITDPATEETYDIEGNFAGLYASKLNLWHSINEFYPKRMTVKAREKITWNLLGFHTISFGVPDYFPILTFEEDGTVLRNDKLDPNAGGAKEFDLPEDERYDEERTEPVKFDGGAYDGTGFWSSGTIDATPYIEYTMRISKPGRYRYACLIHPPMVGTVEVTS
jgi:plastocyanin